MRKIEIMRSFQKNLTRTLRSVSLTNAFGNVDGFTLIEILVAIGLLGIFFTAVTLILHQVLTNIGESRVRTTALALAQAKMEIIRNLPYASVGTVGGIPSGPLLPTENLVIGGQTFTVTTSVVFIDDPFDGLSPQDINNTDYKRTRIEITWGGVYPSRLPVTYVTNIAPKGLESAIAGGTLRVRVFSASGSPVSGATVTIDNTAVTPEIHTQTLTAINGEVTLPGTPPCVTCYQITVTKPLFSTDKTYSASEVANPLQPLATVIAGQTSQLSFAIDQVSSITINSYGSRESGYPPIANVLFTIRGAKIIGYDTNDNSVYKYSYSTNTGGGSVLIAGLEWDTYTLDLTNSAHNLAGSNPISPFAVAPATTLTVPMVAIPKSNTSLLIAVKNAAGQWQASVSTQLTNSTLGVDLTKSTGATGAADFGQAFFGGLTPETYNLRLTLSGYEEATASLPLSSIHQETFTLNLTQ